MQNNFKKFKKVPLIISLCFLLLSCLGYLFLYKKIQDNNLTSRAIEAELQMDTSRKDEIKALDRLLKTVQEERVLLDAHFIQSSDVVPFLDTIEKLAPKVNAEAHVTLVDLSKDGSSLTVGVEANGTFASLYKFITLLENSPYELEFMSMNMQKLEDEASGWLVVIKVKLLSFIP